MSTSAPETTTDTTTGDPQGTPAGPQTGQDVEGAPAGAPDAADGAEGQQDAETFPRAYVERLRAESAAHRTKAADRDALAERLATELVRATGRLADPSDLPFDAALLHDDAALGAALDDLLKRKPHLAARRVAGDVAQGEQGAATPAPFSLLGALRGGAG